MDEFAQQAADAEDAGAAGVWMWGSDEVNDGWNFWVFSVDIFGDGV